MNDYIAGMIARSEHAQRNQSLAPVGDFDMRGEDRQPNRAAQQLGRFFQAAGMLMTRIGERISRQQPIARQTSSRKTPAAENC